jgi:hypothetical protein
MKKMLYASVTACSIALFSCGEKQETVDLGPDKSTLTAQQAGQGFMDDMTSGKIASAWDAFPTSYQDDVEDIVHEFAEKVDADLYNEAMKTLNALNGLFKNKKDIILSVMEKSVPPAEKSKFETVKTNWDVVSNLSDTFLNSGIQNTESLKTLKISDMTAKVQPKLVKVMEMAKTLDNTNSLTSTKVELVSEEGDKVTLKSNLPGGTTQEQILIKHEDRWLPEKLVNEWSTGIDKAKEAVATMSNMQPTEKQQVISLMQMVQASIKELEAAKSAQEMEAIMGAQMEKFGPMLLPLMMSMSPPDQDAPLELPKE